MKMQNMAYQSDTTSYCVSKGRKLKMFLKEQKILETKKPNNNFKNVTTETSLAGEEAKTFYENLIKEQKPIALRIRKKSPPSLRIKTRPLRKIDLLRMAQYNDVKNLNLAFLQSKQSLDLDVCDDFGWTPLMCAASSGAVEAVKLLLENGADSSKCEKVGYTASELARMNNHHNIVEILENFQKKNSEEQPKNITEPSFYCRICDENITSNKAKHESSTLHLFQERNKVKTFYGIPESNKGFQLLLKTGWDKEKGLGRDGTGRKFPIKAVLKKDRTGIGGSKKYKNKSDEQSRLIAKIESKKERVCKMRKEKEFEKTFRLEFS